MVMISSNQENKAQGSELNLAHFFYALYVKKKMILLFVVSGTVLALIVSFLLRPVYTATTVIFPPQQQSNGLASALGSLGAFAGVLGANVKNPNDFYVGMLKSRSVSDQLIKQFDLQNKFGKKTIIHTRSALAGVSTISAGKDGFISISVEYEDPDFAAKLANAYVVELKKLNRRVAVSDASGRRAFYENQLQEIKEQLSDAEIKLRKTQESTGMLLPDGQVKGIMESAAALRAKAAAKEVELSAMSSFATDKNPDYQRVLKELAQLKKQIVEVDQGKSSDEKWAVATSKVPEAGMEYIRALRNVKYYETLFELVSKQYEVSRYDELKDISNIQVLDYATPPDYKSGPKKALIVIAGFFMGLVIGVVVAIFSYARRLEDSSLARFLESFRNINKVMP